MTSTSTSSPELPARVRSDNAVAPAGAAWVMLALATLGFALNFWAWALLSPLGAHLKTSLSLSSFQQALIVAVPVIVGSLGRIPVGALTTLTQSDAAAKMAGFVLVAVALRPLGGYLSDRIGPTPILGAALGVVTLGALVQAGGPALVPTATVAFLTMAAALGLASGAVFALVAQRAPGRQVGAVTGVVGAAGGLGGFIPPLFMGSIYDGSHSYAGGFVALAFVAAATTALVVLIARCRDGTDAGVTPADSAEDLRPGGSDLRPRARGRLAGER